MSAIKIFAPFIFSSLCVCVFCSWDATLTAGEAYSSGQDTFEFEPHENHTHAYPLGIDPVRVWLCGCGCGGVF